MDPYRAPPPEEPPPRDAMRPVLFVAGALAAAIAIAAGVVGLLERAQSRSAASSDSQSSESPGFVAKLFAPHAYEFETSAGVCFGRCIPHLVSIDEAGTVKKEVIGAMYPRQTVTCPPAPPFRAAAADVAKLVELARAVPVETMNTSHPSIITDHSTITTTIIKDHHRFTITHPDELPRLAGETKKRYEGVAELIALRQEIERIANTYSWLEECRVSPRPKPIPDNDINSLLDTR